MATCAQVQKCCSICRQAGAKPHYGAVACNGCRSFFRRTIRLKLTWRCVYSNQCALEDYDGRNSCKKCRFERCLQVGMQRDAVRGPRDSVVRRCITTTATTCHSQNACTNNYSINTISTPLSSSPGSICNNDSSDSYSETTSAAGPAVYFDTCQNVWQQIATTAVLQQKHDVLKYIRDLTISSNTSSDQRDTAFVVLKYLKIMNNFSKQYGSQFETTPAFYDKIRSLMI